MWNGSNDLSPAHWRHTLSIKAIDVLKENPVSPLTKNLENLRPVRLWTSIAGFALMACAGTAIAHPETAQPLAGLVNTSGEEGFETANDSPFEHVYDARPVIGADYERSTAETLAALQSPLETYRLSSQYGWRKKPLTKANRKGTATKVRRTRAPVEKQFHLGVDMAAPSGTPVQIAFDGTVVSLGKKGSYGYYVRVVHENGVETAYAHMSRFAKGLKKGQVLRTGETLGYVGSTGRSTGPHVHYEVLVDGIPVDPQNRTAGAV